MGGFIECIQTEYNIKCKKEDDKDAIDQLKEEIITFQEMKQSIDSLPEHYNENMIENTYSQSMMTQGKIFHDDFLEEKN